MKQEGLAVAPKETTTAPKTMFREEDQDETVARGCIRVMEVIAYDAVGKKKDEDGKDVIVEKGRKPYFCQNSEDFIIFVENNPKARIETFGIHLPKRVALKYMDNPENMKQFERKV